MNVAESALWRSYSSAPSPPSRLRLRALSPVTEITSSPSPPDTRMLPGGGVANVTRSDGMVEPTGKTSITVSVMLI